MKCLVPLLEREDVRSIIARCRESKAVQGVNIRLNRWWLAAWRVAEAYDPFEPQKAYEEHWAEWDLYPPSGSSTIPRLPIRPITPKDLDWQPRHSFYRRTLPPIVFTVRLYPNVAQLGGPPVLGGTQGVFDLIYEVCPLARLYAGPQSSHRPVVGGISIGVNPSDSGTLGGVVRDDMGQYYGITCGHIALSPNNVEQPSQTDGGGGSASTIGSVVHAEVPPPFPSYASAMKKDQKKYAGQFDISIFKISNVKAKQEILKLGKINGIMPTDDLEQDHRLEMTGRTSDWRVLAYGGITPYHNLHNAITGETYCYENPLMLRDSSGSQPVQPGDSGAWVCTPAGPEYVWAGMVVGGDGQVGFAVSAEALKSWWEDAPRSMSLQFL